ncbi:Concanavalin A-like lectin/glucanases superfamily protein [Limimaricola pyoseonensis]|uniref:Concanavalin A-like lectin/glucanases superfamily protein n=2 Tax=Limimaricola pyoseonensis TaxID=521013 RepID=A0A1G7GNG5_9RHOB|nr:Concanavalin A-like lectin/glucanases superfamily protein [Limimaricola pyoseonensis]
MHSATALAFSGTDLTVSFWKRSASGGPSWDTLWTSGTRALQIYSQSTTEQLKAKVNGSPMDTTVGCTDGGWDHVVYQFGENLAGDHDCRCYVNGVYETSEAATLTGLDASGAHGLLGNLEVGPDTDDGWIGAIFDFCVLKGVVEVDALNRDPATGNWRDLPAAAQSAVFYRIDGQNPSDPGEDSSGHARNFVVENDGVALDAADVPPGANAVEGGAAPLGLRSTPSLGRTGLPAATSLTPEGLIRAPVLGRPVLQSGTRLPPGAITTQPQLGKARLQTAAALAPSDLVSAAEIALAALTAETHLTPASLHADPILAPPALGGGVSAGPLGLMAVADVDRPAVRAVADLASRIIVAVPVLGRAALDTQTALSTLHLDVAARVSRPRLVVALYIPPAPARIAVMPFERRVVTLAPEPRLIRSEDHMSRWADKDPDDVLDYAIDWSRLLEGDTIASAEWLVPAGLTFVRSEHSGPLAIAWLSGGEVGETYELTSRITTAAGRQMDRSASLFVTAR